MTLFRKEHEAFRARIRQIVEQRLLPHADEWEAQQEFPAGLFRELGQEGLLGLTFPVDVGGQGLDFGYNVALAEELPRSKNDGPHAQRSGANKLLPASFG